MSGRGLGRVIVTVYGILALAAIARGVVALSTHGNEAPVAYWLSLAAGVIYLVATVAIARDGRWRPVAWVAVGIEMVGVLAVGTWSMIAPERFPDATVWSAYGRGYGWVPLILPVVGLWWLWHTRRGESATIEG